jgi:membrane protein YqaA with SNARE-associated domain
MKLFGPLYDLVMRWSAHKHAPWYLGFVSFIEAIFFPVPVVFMLAPMVAAQPSRGLYLASLTTVTSVAGGVCGYLLGIFLIDAVFPLIEQWGHADSYELAREWFDRWGFWALFLAGISPIPYKVFTIAAGSLSMALLPFIIASLIGRAGQFFLAAGLIMLLGPKVLPMVRRYVEWLGWGVLVLAVVIYLFIR